MLLLHKIIVLLQINLFLISVDCLKKLESNLVLDEKNDNNNKDLIEKLLATNYNPAKQNDIKNTNPQVQVFTDQKTTNTNQHGLSKYQNFLNQQNYQHNYASKNYRHHQIDNNPNNKMSSPQITAEQKEIIESFQNIRNYQKRDNNNQTKKTCPFKNKKHDNDDEPTPTYFYPKHIKGELVVHNPAPIIVKRPPTKVVVNHPAIIVRPQPVLINRAPQAINPVMVYKPPPAPPAEPLKIRPVFVKFESDGSSPSYNGGYQHRGMPDNGHHHRMPDDGYNHRMPDDIYQHRMTDDGYSHRMPHDNDDDDEKDGLYGAGTNVNFNDSPYYNNDGYQAKNNYGPNLQSRYNGYNNYNREYNM